MDDLDRETLLNSLQPFPGHLNAVAELFTLSGQESEYVRRCLLVACLRKTSQQAEAIMMLSRSGFLEESTAIARMLIEAIVNAIYLQTAEESELNRFLRYDSQKMSIEHISSLLEYGKDDAAVLEQEKLVAQVLQSGISEKAISWSVRKLHQRANKADSDNNLAALGKLHSLISRVSNFAVHSTLPSKVHLFPKPADTSESPRNTLHGLSLQLVEQALNVFTRYAIRSAESHLNVRLAESKR